jgi:hypothetical protein
MPKLRRYWTTFREPWESLQIHVDQASEVGDKVVVLGRAEGHARHGMSVQREVAWIWRFVDELGARVDSYRTWKRPSKPPGSGSRRFAVAACCRSGEGRHCYA